MHYEPAEDVVIYIPANKKIIRISEGSGDNLAPEDIEDGCIDYLNYDIYDPEETGISLDDPDIMDKVEEADSEDGGMLMYKEYIQSKFNSLVDTIPDILDFTYSNKDLGYEVLAGGSAWK